MDSHLGLTTHVEIGEPEKFTQPRSADSAFILIDLTLQFQPHQLSDAPLHSLGCFPAFAINHEVVPVADELVHSAFQFLIQLVKDDVGQ